MANIVNIKEVDITSISEKDIFVIDTNVLIWTHYSRASHPSLKNHPYQVYDYPNFIYKLLENGNKLITTELNITELLGVVERNEFQIYKAANNKNLKKKEFRKIATERAKYKSEIDTMIMEIKTLYDNQIEIIELGEELIAEFQNKICKNICDVFDYAILEHFKKRNITNFISDDKDFSSIDGINLFTSYE